MVNFSDTVILSALKDPQFGVRFCTISGVVLVVQRFGVGFVIERSLVRLPPGTIKSTRSTQPSIPSG